MYPSGERRFLATNRITMISLFVLILVGGIVRSTGAGMVCPDWPKCFNRIVPPSKETDIPNGYKEQFVKKSIEKNHRLAEILDVLGLDESAQLLRDDTSILKPKPFNAVKGWAEYLNRMVVLLVIGLLLAGAFLSVGYLKSRKRIFFLSVLNLFLASFQAWLGSLLVVTSYLAWMVTIHSLLAILILGISIYIFFQAKLLRDRNLLSNEYAGVIRILTLIALVLTIIQIALGTNVREQIDVVSVSMDGLNRSEWIHKVGFEFYLHRGLALIVFIFNFILLVLIRRKYMGSTYHFRYMTYVALIIAVQIVTGLTLSRLALPPVAQSVHLFLACLIFGTQYYLLLLLKQNKLYKSRIVR